MSRVASWAITVFFILRFFVFVQENVPAVAGLVRAQGDPDLRRLDPVIFAVPIQAARVIPASATFDIATAHDFARISAKYFLYPRKIAGDPDYLIGSEYLRPHLPKAVSSRQLPGGAVVFAKPGHGWAEGRSGAPSPTLLDLLGVALVSAAACLMAGILLAAALGLNRHDAGLAWYLGASYLLGFFFQNLMLWLGLLLGAQLTPGFVLTGWLSVVAGCAVLAYPRLKDQVLACPRRERIHCSGQRCWPAPGVAATAMVALLLALFAAATPVHDWDSLSHWLLKAKVLFHERTLALDYTHVNYYPLLWPLQVASQYAVLGGANDILANLSCALFNLVLVSQLVGGLVVIGQGRAWSAWPLMLFFIFFYDPSFFFPRAELPFLAFFAAALVAVLLWLRDPSRGRYLLTAGLLLSGLGLTKFEGGVTALLTGLALFIATRKTLTLKTTGRIAILSLVPGILAAGWFLWCRGHGYLGPISHFQDPFSVVKAARLLVETARSLVQAGPTMLIFAGTMAWLLFPVRPRGWGVTEIFLGSCFLLLALFSVAAIGGWQSQQFAAQLGNTSSRLFLHAVPALLFLAAGSPRLSAGGPHPPRLSTQEITSWIPRVLPGAVFLLALAPRWLLLSLGPYSKDCLLLADQAQKTWQTGQLFYLQGAGHPLTALTGAFFVGLGRWFGAGDPVRAVNLMSAMVTSLCVPVLFLLVRDLFDRRAALFAAVLFCFHPIFWAISVFGNSHGQSILFMLMAFRFLIQYFRSASRRDLVTGGVCLGLMAAARYQDVTLMIFPTALLFFLKLGKEEGAFWVRKPSSRLVPLAVFLAAGALTAVLFYLPWPCVDPESRQQTSRFFSTYVGSELGRSFLGWASPALKTSFGYVVTSLSGLGLLTATLGWLIILVQVPRRGLFLFAWLLVPFLICGNLAITLPRYLMIPSIPLIIAEGLLLSYLSRTGKGRGALAVGLLTLVLSFNISRIYPVLRFRHDHALLPDFARWVAAQTPDNAFIIEADNSLFHRYYGKRATIGPSFSLFDNAVNARRMADFRRKLDEALAQGIPVYSTASGLLGYRPEYRFAQFMKDHYLIEFVGEHAIEGWHKGCLTLELGKNQLFRIRQK